MERAASSARAGSGAGTAATSSCHWATSAAQMLRLMLGSRQTSHASRPTITGTAVSTHTVTTARAAGLSSRTRGLVARPGTRLDRMGPTREKRSGTPMTSATMK